MDIPILLQVNNSADTKSVNTKSVNTVSVNTEASEKESFWGKDGFTFGDVLDMINPLQHLPFVAKYYREQANDDACEGSKLIGGVLFGGVFGGAGGVVSAIANSAIRHETHQDVSEHLLDIVDGSYDDIQITKTMSETNYQSAVVSNDTLNPFFAQALDEYSNESSDFSSRKGMSIQHSTDWGKV